MKTISPCCIFCIKTLFFLACLNGSAFAGQSTAEPTDSRAMETAIHPSETVEELIKQLN